MLYVFLSFAAYRATRAVTLDSVTDGFRNWMQYKNNFLSQLVSCGYCIGFWLSGVTYLTYILIVGQWDRFPILMHVIAWWTVAGGQAMLIAIDSFLLREAPPK